jgi:hypothetical protein
MLQTPTPPPLHVDAATTAAAAANKSAIMTSSGGTPVAAIGLKSIGATILNVLAGNRGGSGATQTTAANAITPKELRL